MTILSRDQLNARLVVGHYLERRADGTVAVTLRDEVVQAELFEDVRVRGLVEEVRAGWWAVTDKGGGAGARRNPPKSVHVKRGGGF